MNFSYEAVSAPNKEKSVNIVKNGGFESGKLAPGWIQTPGSAKLDAEVVSDEKYSGNYSLKMGSMDFIEQNFFPTKAKGNLSFRAKVQSAVTAGPFYVRIVYRDNTETVHFVSLSEEWELYKVPVNSSKFLAKIQFGTGETGPLYIDDVTLDGTKNRLRRRYRIGRRELKKIYGLPDIRIPGM